MRYRSLDAARERAEAASQAKNRFLATISHELRTPLNGILGLNDLLLESGLTAAQETYARGVRSSGTALLALVEDLLDFSKIEAGRLDLRPEPASLERLIEEVAEILAPRAHQKGIDFAVDLDPAIPARLLVDAARLRQVVINLAGNAVKFTEAGGVTISAAVEGRTPGLRISLAVADSGPGIPPGDAERLFREFEQADPALTRRHGGAGLGLAISRRIVAAMGGSLSVAPRPGGGSIFRFALHLGGIAGERPALPSLARRRLLVVMPEGFEATVVARDLVRGGAEARRVGTVNAAAALAGAAEAAGLPYHAVLLDRRCVADPRVAMARLREAAGGRMACVLLVSPADRGEIARFREAGLDGYLVRPVWRRSLVGGTAAAIEGVGDFHPDPRDRERQAPPPVRAGASGLQILLAEDDEISALLARAVIESEGHAVTDVRDGHSAVAAAVEGEGRFDLAFLDLHMPGIDGLAAAVRIRDHERTTGRRRLPLVALTADTLPETRRAALAAGIDSVVEKPASPAVLRAAIADFAPGFGSA
jgi:CheY-like chemotaxis protein